MQAKECRIIIDSDEEIDGGLSCLIDKKEIGTQWKNNDGLIVSNWDDPYMSCKRARLAEQVDVFNSGLFNKIYYKSPFWRLLFVIFYFHRCKDLFSTH